jgi:hypothetical protein
MTRFSKGASIAVLGDSSATLYTQADPKMTSRRAGHLPWSELITAPGDAGTTSVSLARVAQSLSQGMAGPYQALTELRPDVIVMAHGGREGIVRIPRRLEWLRCYADATAGESWRNRFVARPLWRVLLASLSRRSRLTARVLHGLHIRPVQSDAELYRQELQDAVTWMVESLGARVVLVTTFPWRQSFWPWFPHVLEANDRAAEMIAARWPGRVSVVELRGELSGAHYSTDGAHLSIEGHIKAASLISQHIAAMTAAESLTAHAQRGCAAVA